MSNQITHAEYESKVKQCQNSMSATKFCDYLFEGKNRRRLREMGRGKQLPHQMGSVQQAPYGMASSRRQVAHESHHGPHHMPRERTQISRTHMDKMRGSILDLCDQRFLDSMTPEAVPVSENPQCADTPADAETSSGTCCAGAEQNTADSSSSDDEDDDE